MEAAYEVNPNLLYFGVDENSLDDLRFNGNNYANYNTYADALSGKRPGNLGLGEANVVTDAFYNTYQKDEAIFNASLEHSYLDSKLRLLGGYELAWINISTFDNKTSSGNDVANGQSLLQHDYFNKSVLGVGNNIVSFLQAGIVYDTRDLETDPSKGIFAELTNEFLTEAIGSKYNFNKTFAHAKFYAPLFPKAFKRLILATRAGLGYTVGDAPFFEYQDQWSSEGSIEGLGGAHTI
jgi:outer membrane protein assembly factor BamA